MQPEPAPPPAPPPCSGLRDPDDRDAWAAFAGQYGDRVRAWCLRWGLREPTPRTSPRACSSTCPARCRRSFTTRPAGASAWLKTVVRRAVIDHVRGQGRAVRGSGDSAVRGRLEAVEAQDDLLAHLADLFDLELLEEAMAGCAPCATADLGGVPAGG